MRKKLGLLTIIVLLMGATAPKPKTEPPIKREEIVGGWSVSWGNIEYYYYFHKQGDLQSTYLRDPKGTSADMQWLGVWSFSKNQLTIKEKSVVRDTDGFIFNFITEMFAKDYLAETVIELRRPSRKEKGTFIGKGGPIKFVFTRLD